MPESVLHERRLSVHARLVYAELALWVFQGNTCTVGTRQMAERLGMSRTTVNEVIQQLESLGLLAVSNSGRGKRTVYVLNSPVFAQKQGKVTEVVSAPGGARRYASVNKAEVA